MSSRDIANPGTKTFILMLFPSLILLDPNIFGPRPGLKINIQNIAHLSSLCIGRGCSEASILADFRNIKNIAHPHSNSIVAALNMLGIWGPAIRNNKYQ